MRQQNSFNAIKMASNVADCSSFACFFVGRPRRWWWWWMQTNRTNNIFPLAYQMFSSLICGKADIINKILFVQLSSSLAPIKRANKFTVTIKTNHFSASQAACFKQNDQVKLTHLYLLTTSWRRANSLSLCIYIPNNNISLIQSQLQMLWTRLSAKR